MSSIATFVQAEARNEAGAAMTDQVATSHEIIKYFYLPCHLFVILLFVCMKFARRYAMQNLQVEFAKSLQAPITQKILTSSSVIK